MYITEPKYPITMQPVLYFTSNHSQNKSCWRVQGKDSTAYTGGLVGGGGGEAVEGEGEGGGWRLTEPPKRGTGLSTQRERRQKN